MDQAASFFQQQMDLCIQNETPSSLRNLLLGMLELSFRVRTLCILTENGKNHRHIIYCICV